MLNAVRLAQYAQKNAELGVQRFQKEGYDMRRTVSNPAVPCPIADKAKGRLVISSVELADPSGFTS